VREEVEARHEENGVDASNPVRLEHHSKFVHEGLCLVGFFDFTSSDGLSSLGCQEGRRKGARQSNRWNDISRRRKRTSSLQELSRLGETRSENSSGEGQSSSHPEKDSPGGGRGLNKGCR